MTRQHISDSLKEFIRDQIQTVFRLEVLLLLHRDQSRSFTAAEVADELCFETDIAQEQLSVLAALGLVLQSDNVEREYSYHPVDAARGSMVDQLAAGYSTQRVPILSVILAEHPDRTRLFAEAFRIIRRND